MVVETVSVFNNYDPYVRVTRYARYIRGSAISGGRGSSLGDSAIPGFCPRLLRHAVLSDFGRTATGRRNLLRATDRCNVFEKKVSGECF
jgi:hypothetical protein